MCLLFSVLKFKKPDKNQSTMSKHKNDLWNVSCRSFRKLQGGCQCCCRRRRRCCNCIRRHRRPVVPLLTDNSSFYTFPPPLIMIYMPAKAVLFVAILIFDACLLLQSIIMEESDILISFPKQHLYDLCHIVQNGLTIHIMASKKDL